MNKFNSWFMFFLTIVLIFCKYFPNVTKTINANLILDIAATILIFAAFLINLISNNYYAKLLDLYKKLYKDVLWESTSLRLAISFINEVSKERKEIASSYLNAVFERCLFSANIFNSLKNKPIDKIPKGSHCFDGYGYCQYWAIDFTRPKKKNGYCAFLDKGDWNLGDSSSLYDQCKICGVNESLEDNNIEKKN